MDQHFGIQGVGSNRYYVYRQCTVIDTYRRNRNSKRTVGL